MILNVALLATTNIVLYVSNSGSDLNCGLSADAPFQTIQHAVDVATSDWMPAPTNTVTISVTNGTYAGAFLYRGSGPGSFILSGNSSSPGSVILTNSSSSVLQAMESAVWTVDGFTFQSTSGGNGIASGKNATVYFGDSVFGTGLGTQLVAWEGGRISAVSNYAVTGGAHRHMFATSGASISIPNRTVTLTGTPNFDYDFAEAVTGGIIQAYNCTFSGAATGIRFSVTINGTIYYGGAAAGANYFPGNAAGYIATGGQYQ